MAVIASLTIIVTESPASSGSAQADEPPISALPAIVALERERCATIQVSGQGAIWVKASDGQPGRIHSDSSAQVPPCTTNMNPGGHNVFGTAMPSSLGGGPSIRADGVGDTPGTISMYSLSPGVDGRGGAIYEDDCNWIDAMVPECVGSGLTSPPTGGPIISRRPVDELYQENIATLYAELRTRVHWTWEDAQAAGFTVLVSDNDCSAGNRVYGTATDRVFVACDTFSAANVVFNGREVVFTGRISIQNGYQAFPNVRKLHVGGCASPDPAACVGIDVRSGGTFAVNSGTTQSTPPASWPVQSCLMERPPLDPSQNWAELAMLRGSLFIGNHHLQLCQTMALLSYDTGSSYQPIQRSDGGNCSVVLPCPADSSDAIVGSTKPRLASFNTSSIRWTAPDRNAGKPTDFGGDSPFEDLALWTEVIGLGNDACSLSGQAGIEMAGTFFYPNCHLQYGGHTSNAVPYDARLIGRTLNHSGMAVLALRPSAVDAEPPPTTGAPTVSVGDAAVVEGDSGKPRAVTFSITLSEPADHTVTVDYEIRADGSATAADETDFRPRSRTVVFRPSSRGLTPTSRLVTTQVHPDTQVEGDETFEIVLSNPTGGYVVGAGRGTGTIIDDDQVPAAIARLDVGDITVWEGDDGVHNTGRVWVTLSEPTDEAVTVEVTLVPGTAIAGHDYRTLGKSNSKTLRFRPGQVRRAVPIKIFPDQVVEGDQTLTVVVSSPSGPVALGRTVGLVTILDDDAGSV
jgi:hypothetical protein